MAGFNTAVTGLKSASTMLDVAGNNIANSSTVGFKASRTEFADIYATSVVGAGSSNQAGSGVTVSDISQDFSAGTIEFTNNNLDLAINGSGFFQLNDGQGGITYTRAGSFELDKDGNIVSKNGKYLQGFEVDEEGKAGTVVVNLAVSQKESPPKATENIDMSFNIDSTLDAQSLNREFDRTEPGSYTYSTTVETVDSLGNSNSIRFYMVEQAAYREGYTYSVSGVTNSFTDEISISGITFTYDELSNLSNSTTAEYKALAARDPRIDLSTFSAVDNGSGSWEISFEFFAEATNSGDMFVTSVDSTVTLDPGNPIERAANEVRSATLTALDGTAAVTLTDPTFYVGGVKIVLTGTFSDTDVLGNQIASKESQIIDGNPDIESVEYNSGQLIFTYKAEAGLIQSPITIDNTFTDITTGTYVFDGSSIPEGDIADAELVDVGDNSYLGSYLMFAFLQTENATTALDIGKISDPGDPNLTSATEEGPILIKFDPTNGILSEVNGETAQGSAPSITILGADPAQLVDDGTGIKLDITGSSQFASESIVKAIGQDGYPKGDLIGVTFEENGAMVASFSNGQRQDLGRVGIASFENQSGLRSAGNTEWIASLSSGAAVLNVPGSGLNGTLRSAALESSNVDLSAELVKLIEAQRNFQANSKTLETQNTVTQAILQI